MIRPVIRTVADSVSTNSDLLTLIAQGSGQDDLWLRAERQSGGRGRLGRSWTGDQGNLYLSTMVRLFPDDPPVCDLALIAALAAWEAVEDVMPDASSLRIKWPNDLLFGGAKLAGILLERSGDFVVAGFGMNVTHAPEIEGRETVSLHAAGVPTAIQAGDMAERIADRFARWVGRWRNEGRNAIFDAWVCAAEPLGTRYRVVGPDGATVEGCFAGLAPDGAMVLDNDLGGQIIIHAGDVFAMNLQPMEASDASRN